MIWNKEILQEEANKYKTRTEFSKQNAPAYNSANRFKIIDDLFKNHINSGYTFKQHIKGYWTEERLQIEANKYITRQEFKRKDYAAYNAAGRLKLIDKLFEKHINKGYNDNQNFDVKNKSKYIIYSYEFKEYNNVYVGLTNNIKIRDIHHLYDNSNSMYKFRKKYDLNLPNYIILEDNLKSFEAKNREEFWVNHYKNNNWKIINVAKTGSLGNNKNIWTYIRLQKEVNKYNTRNEFKHGNNGAYQAARKRNLLDELFKDHENNGFTNKKVVTGYWIFDKLQEEVNKYNTRQDLYKNNINVYDAARAKGVLNELFKNHKNNGYTNKMNNK